MVENFGSLYRKLLKVIFPKSNGNLKNNDIGGLNTQVNVIIDQFFLDPDEHAYPIGSRILIRFRILSMNGSIRILKIIASPNFIIETSLNLLVIKIPIL